MPLEPRDGACGVFDRPVPCDRSSVFLKTEVCTVSCYVDMNETYGTQRRISDSGESNSSTFAIANDLSRLINLLLSNEASIPKSLELEAIWFTQPSNSK